MTSIPGGAVWRGCIDGDPDCTDSEMPGRWIEISAFYIDEFEVTVDGYVACVDAGDCQPTPGEPDCNATFVDRGNHPINCLTWDDANTYCTAQGKRLPTEAEWERAPGVTSCASTRGVTRCLAARSLLCPTRAVTDAAPARRCRSAHAATATRRLVWPT